MNPYYNPERLDNSRGPVDFETMRKLIVLESGKRVDRAIEHSNGVTKESVEHFFTQKKLQQVPKIAKAQQVTTTPYIVAKQQLERVYGDFVDAEVQEAPNNVIQMPAQPMQPQLESQMPIYADNIVPMPTRLPQQRNGNDLPLPNTGEYRSA